MSGAATGWLALWLAVAFLGYCWLFNVSLLPHVCPRPSDPVGHVRERCSPPSATGALPEGSLWQCDCGKAYRLEWDRSIGHSRGGMWRWNPVKPDFLMPDNRGKKEFI